MLAQKEQARLQVLNSLLAEHVSLDQAATLMGVSARHTRRILAAYREEGAAALAHGNRGLRSTNATPETTRAEVLRLARSRYPDANHSHLSELLREREGIQQSRDLYELVIARHRTASFVITSNRAVDEWLGLFDDPILGNSALDRLANASYQIVIEGASYRERLSPHRALLDRKEVVDPQT